MSGNSGKTTKQLIWIGVLVTVPATALLIAANLIWDDHIAEYIGFGLLVGFSVAAICK